MSDPCLGCLCFWTLDIRASAAREGRVLRFTLHHSGLLTLQAAGERWSPHCPRCWELVAGCAWSREVHQVVCKRSAAYSTVARCLKGPVGSRSCSVTHLFLLLGLQGARLSSAWFGRPSTGSFSCQSSWAADPLRQCGSALPTMCMTSLEPSWWTGESALPGHAPLSRQREPSFSRLF